MRPKSRKQFTLKIIAGYLALGFLALLSGYLIYSEFEDYTASQLKVQDNQKILQTNVLLTKLYEAENLSKLALQTRKSQQLKNYAGKVDSIVALIDSLKLLTDKQPQIQRLDTVQHLLKLKVHNNAELRKLKLKTEQTAPLDSILKAINKMEIDMGRITPETFVPNFDKLSLETQKSIREYVAILNKNIPESTDGATKTANLDSILQLSKSLLNKAKNESQQLERSLVRKELEIYKTDLELSQKLRSIIATFQQEIVTNAYLDGIEKEKVVKRSIRFAGLAIVLGLLIAVLFTLLVSNDFLKSQRYREQLEEEKAYSEFLLKSREQLISTVSHDLRSPLGTIKGYSELLEQKVKEKKSNKYIKQIQSALGYIENLVKDLLDFSRLEGGKLHVEKKPFFLHEVLSMVTSHYEDIKNKKSIELNVRIGKGLNSPIMGDPLRLSQILNNLVGNALKFTEEGFVRIEASVRDTTKGPYLSIKVRDSGIGIKKSKQAMIFKEFTQAGDSANRKYEGYGLGLTISKKLCELLGGYLELESEENKGSTFTVSLPLEFASKSGIVTKKEEKTTPFTHSILIFEDDPALLQLLLELCTTQNINALGYARFDDLAKNDNLVYDVVLTDIQMEGANGFDVLKRLRTGNYDHYQNQPIVAMTGQRDLERSTFLNAGFDEVLLKPFAAETLLKTLNKVADLNQKKQNAKNEILQTIAVRHTTFSLKSISSFLDSQEALHDVLVTFLDNTKNDLQQLENAINQTSKAEIQSLSHRMLPMFRQLDVYEAIPLLEKMEHIGKCEKRHEIQKDFDHLKRIVTKLEDEILNLITTRPVDTD
nr:ATP-binding protein [Allomuricauda sp.]